MCIPAVTFFYPLKFCSESDEHSEGMEKKFEATLNGEKEEKIYVERKTIFVVIVDSTRPNNSPW